MLKLKSLLLTDHHAKAMVQKKTVPCGRLKKRGYVSLLEIYMKIGLPSINGGSSLSFPTI
jgi:hypothetical protein